MKYIGQYENDPQVFLNITYNLNLLLSNRASVLWFFVHKFFRLIFIIKGPLKFFEF